MAFIKLTSFNIFQPFSRSTFILSEKRVLLMLKENRDHEITGSLPWTSWVEDNIYKKGCASVCRAREIGDKGAIHCQLRKKTLYLNRMSNYTSLAMTQEQYWRIPRQARCSFIICNTVKRNHENDASVL